MHRRGDVKQIYKDEGRNLGVDLLRILMMTGIVMLHFLGHGGLLEWATSNGGNYELLWLFRGFSCMSVNCFVLITGYFQSKGTFKLHKLLLLIAQIVFWSLITYGISVIVGTNEFSVKDLIKAAAPFFFGGYWFTTVYIVMYALSPFINKGLATLNKKQHMLLSITMALVFTFPFLDEVLGIKSGYGLLWFVALYVIGAYFREYSVLKTLNTPVCIVIYIVCILVLWLPQIISIPGMSIVSIFTGGYSSIPILLAAISLFVVFSRIRVPALCKKIIAFVSPLTLGVYLVHDGEFFRETFWKWVNTLIVPEFSTVHVWIVPLVVIAIFIVCILMDAFRVAIFKLLRIEKLIMFISKKMTKLINFMEG